MIQELRSIWRTLTGRGAEVDETWRDEVDHQQLAQDALDGREYPEMAETLHYCGYCGQVFATGDVFYEHRVAGVGFRGDGDEDFRARQRLRGGDEFPDDARVGALEACPGPDAQDGDAR